MTDGFQASGLIIAGLGLFIQQGCVAVEGSGTSLAVDDRSEGTMFGPNWRAQDEEESTEDDGGPAEVSDLCADAPSIGEGRWYSSLAQSKGDLRICGKTGPEGFYRLRMPVRGDLWVQGFARDFSPIVGVMTGTCMVEPTFLCTQDTGAYLLDLPAGTELIIGVTVSSEDESIGESGTEEGPDKGPNGGDNEEFGLAARSEASTSESEESGTSDVTDPLEFALDVGFRRILSEGQVCRPLVLGRCESGTHCLPDSEYLPETNLLFGQTPKRAQWRCQSVPGETCGFAQEITIDGPMAVEIDPGSNYSDDHDHSCVGLRLRDRVLRMRFTAEFREEIATMPPGVGFRLWTDHPGVGLAVREPGCLSGSERQCAPYGMDGAEIELDNLQELAARDGSPFVFLEYAAAPLGPQQPFVLQWAIVDASSI